MKGRGAGVLVRNLSCRYGASVAVEDVGFHVAPGERVAIVGGNGSGKTTLLRALLGLHRANSGEMALDGTRAGDWTAWRRRIAWVPQLHGKGLFPLRVADLIESTACAALVPAALERFGLDGLGPHPISRLSGGQRQRAYLARAWAAIEDHADLLLADEPTAALDFESRDQVTMWIETLAVSALVVTHDPKIASRCDRVLEMAAGRLREAA